MNSGSIVASDAGLEEAAIGSGWGAGVRSGRPGVGFPWGWMGLVPVGRYWGWCCPLAVVHGAAVTTVAQIPIRVPAFGSYCVYTQK